MGSCLCKCSRKRKRDEEDDFCDDDTNRNSEKNSNGDNIVQDKHLIEVPKTPPPPPLSPLSVSTPTKNLLSPTPSSTTFSSSSSLSAFSCSSTNKTTSSSSSSLSSSSSIISTYKDKSFSNDFLWSRVKENPHVIHNIGQIKKATLIQKQDIPTKVEPHTTTTPNKRARSDSPTLSRQKSFRRTLPDKSTPMRSPSPSRIRGNLSHTAESRVKHLVKRENIRPSSPNNNNVRRSGPCLMNRDTCSYRIGSKVVAAAAVGKSILEQGSSDVAMEDIDNPLIDLDCFIFL